MTSQDDTGFVRQNMVEGWHFASEFLKIRSQEVHAKVRDDLCKSESAILLRNVGRTHLPCVLLWIMLKMKCQNFLSFCSRSSPRGGIVRNV